MHLALNQLSEADPAWVRQRVPLEWYARSGPRAERFRLPKDASKRETLACLIGADGYQLMDWVLTTDRSRHLRDLPALEVLHRIWLQHYYRCTVPGMEEIRWRTTDNRPPSAMLIQSPYDLEARYSHKRETQRVG
jgi:transposase